MKCWSKHSLLGALGLIVGADALAKSQTDMLPPTTPPGIRQKMAYLGKPTPDEHPALIFTDQSNKPLYVFDKDTAGKPSSCAGECAAHWIAVLAPANTRAIGDWSIVKRPSRHEMQWSFRGKPVYTFPDDQAVVPSAPGPGGRHDLSKKNRANGDSVAGVWHSIRVTPTETQLPGGFTVAAVSMAPGQVLIDSNERTLYVFDGPKEHSEQLRADWIPVAAPYLAKPIGRFRVIANADGSYQWSMNGQPLYRYRYDWVLGDANGRNVDPAMRAAYISRDFMPPGVEIQSDEKHGGLFVTAQGRLPLYTVDIAWVDPEGGHNTRGVRSDSGTGEQINVTGCQGACEQYWKPLAAPPDASPSGYWSIYTRPDGSKQWAYQGFALYTFIEDSHGGINGHDVYRMTVASSEKETLPANLGTFWRAVAP
jgi:predicted lipoprotein with Yx(FWY)xxD motif